MRKLLSINAVALGAVGVMLCVAAIGVGWWTAVRIVERIDRVAARVGHGLSETDARLARVESRVSRIRSEINDIRGDAEAIIAENPELPRVRAEIERLFDRLVPALDRVEATADSLRSVAAALRTAADIVDQLNDDPGATVRVRNAADEIDRAAEALNAPRAKIEEVKSANAVQLTNKLVALTREAVAGSDLLAEGLAAARLEIAVAQGRTTEYRDLLIFRVYATAAVHTLFWLWGGLGQLCLIAWGRRRISTQVPAIA